MCDRCNGLGSYYKQPFAGVWAFEPCFCEQSKTYRELQEIEFAKNRIVNAERIKQAKIKFGMIENDTA